MYPEADLVMAIQQENKLQGDVFPLLHVKGHQDNQNPYEKLPFLAQCQIDCDITAESTEHSTAKHQTFHPYLGS